MATPQGPTVAFHTLTAYDSHSFLLFGGDGGPSMPIQTLPDSAWSLEITRGSSVTWDMHSSGWASQPPRRTYHSAAADQDHNVWITGGQKADGSAIGFQEVFTFTSQLSTFSQFDTTAGYPPPALVGHGSVILPTGLLLVFGGYSSSLNTLVPLSVLFYLDTTSSSPVWGNITVPGAIPSPRRNFATALLDRNRILIHGGGDATLQNVYSDGAILDMSLTPISWVPANGLIEGLGPRVDHTAIGIGSNVFFMFGQ